MALIEIKADPALVHKLVAVLERIADGIDRAYPKPLDPVTLQKMKPHGPEDLVEFTPEEEWARQEEEEARGRS